MLRILPWCLLFILAVLMGAGPGWAQIDQRPLNPNLDEMKYKALWGRPPPSLGQDKAKEAEEAKKAEEARAAEEAGKAEEGETRTTEEYKPRYRFADDPLLNPPGQRAPAAPSASPAPDQSAPPAYPRAPARPPGLGYSREVSSGLEAPATALPLRRVRVVVTDDQGKPIPLAQVSISTRQYIFLREGLTGEDGVFTTSVPCYLPGRQPMLAHTLRVSSALGSLERLVVTRQGSCHTPDRVEVMLADPNRLLEMERRYKERQELYEQEEEEQKAKEEKEQELEQAPGKPKVPGKPKTPGKATPGVKK